jgi:hypothetical protein
MVVLKADQKAVHLALPKDSQWVALTVVHLEHKTDQQKGPQMAALKAARLAPHWAGHWARQTERQTVRLKEHCSAPPKADCSEHHSEL